MGLFARIAAGAGWNSGRIMRAALAATDANFQLIEAPGIRTSAAADYVPVLTDRMILRSNAAAQTLTLPTNAVAAFGIGTTLDVIQSGAGALTLVAPAGGTINKLAGKGLVLNGQWSVVRLRKISANGWVATGDLA